MTTVTSIDELKAMGLRLVPVGGRPPKTARDVAVYMACAWFEAGSPDSRPKVGQSVVDLWQSNAYTGITDPAHVVARKAVGKKAAGRDHSFVIFKGAGTTRRHVGNGAAVLLFPASSITEQATGNLRFHGPIWAWAHGEEIAEHYEATGEVAFRLRG